MISIDWKPNAKDQLPLYQQIKIYIRNKIEDGTWPVHSKLPPQRELARLWGVNRSTLITAIEELTADGLLMSRSGSGIWVANNTWSTLASLPQVNWNDYIESGVSLPNFDAIQDINRYEFQPGILRLGTGELSPDLIPADTLRQVIKKLPNRQLSFGYEEPKGMLLLRQAVSKHLKLLGIRAEPASILIVSGALQALQLICSGLLPPNAGVFLENPSYLYSLRFFQSMSIRLNGLPMDQDGIKMDVLQYRHIHKKAAVLYTIPCFHNPTGRLMTAGRRREVLSFCETEQLPVIEDDVYRDVWLDEAPPAPLKALDRSGLVLYIGSFSKALSPGLRIGWVVGPEPVIDRLADIKMQYDYGSSSLSQWVAAEYLQSGLYQRHLAELRPKLRLRRQIAHTALHEYFGDIATWNMPQGGFYIWLELKHPVPLPKLFKLALSEGILFNPGNLYDPLSSRHLRLSYSYAALSELKEGYRRLAEVIRICS